MMIGFPPLPTEEEMQRSYEAGMRSKKIMGRLALDFPCLLAELVPSPDELCEFARLKATSSVSV